MFLFFYRAPQNNPYIVGAAAFGYDQAYNTYGAPAQVQYPMPPQGKAAIEQAQAHAAFTAQSFQAYECTVYMIYFIF